MWPRLRRYGRHLIRMRQPRRCWYLWSNERNHPNGQRKAPTGAGGFLATILLAVLKLDPRSVVVEHNREIVRRLELDQHALHEGDQVELVHFVGGG